MFFSDDTKSTYIQVRSTVKQKQELQKLAKKEGLTLTKFIFKCVDYYLKSTVK